MDYTPLSAERNEIRLIKMLPHEDHIATDENYNLDLLKCIMEHHSLDELNHSSEEGAKNQYIALSYCWGSWEDCQFLSINDQPTQVTKNLHDCLQMISTWSSQPWIWIDALCINQEDIDERSLQVKRMGSIYQRASKVLAWVGPSSEDSSTAIQLLKSTYAHNKTIGTGPGRKEKLHVWLNERPAGSWCALGRLWNRPYWTRLWILQEIVLNDRLLVACGGDIVDWNILSIVVHRLREDSTDFDLRYRNDCKVLGISHIPLIGYARLVQLVVVRWSCRRAEYNLGQALVVVRASRQFDIKDRVYGALNLIPPIISARIEPDYRLSVLEIFTNFAMTCINSTKSLDILRHARNNETKESFSKNVLNWTSHKLHYGDPFPSWVPDLGREVESWNPSGDIPYNATSNTIAQVELVDSKCLIAQGFRIDDVDGLGSCFLHDITKEERMHFIGHGSIEPFLGGKPVTQPTTQGPQQTPYHDEEGLRDALCKTMVAGRNGFSIYDPPGPGLAQSLLDLPLFFAPDGPEVSLSNENSYRRFAMICHCSRYLEINGRPFSSYFLEPGPQIALQSVPHPGSMKVAISTLMLRRLLVTGKGYVGLADPKAQKGDIIVLMYGSLVPLILRPRDRAGFTLVGEAYVQGIMNGEAMEWLKNGEYQLENFEIY